MGDRIPDHPASTLPRVRTVVALARTPITWHRDLQGAEDTAREVRAHGRQAFVEHADLTRLPDAVEVVDVLADRLGRVDVLVNNAGTGTATTQRRPGVPLGRPGDAREVAAVIDFLAGPDASYVTGASWAVDGGMPRMGPMAGSHLQDGSWRQA
ncbi:SDR family oxidoreductase [Streptomyces sp. NPDC101160]|uniref:SDR family oxidoreductase n=1 Tax=Streptomyces sp. NPDC101160 TaxID=3366118 RepID=UPI003806DB67